MSVLPKQARMSVPLMSTELDQAREIAERVARRVSSIAAGSTPKTSSRKPEVTAELAAVRDGISELQRKLSQLEEKISAGSIQQRASYSSTAPNQQAFDS